jgi:ribosomal-protein-alanine N-acetyltransferase
MNKPLFQSVPSLETERLLLRQPGEHDQEGIFAVFSDPAVTRYHDSDTYTQREQASGWLERRRKALEMGRAIRWAITRKSEGIFLGSCGFGGWDTVAATAEVGYELNSAYWRQGIMSEALEAILRFGFEQMRLQRITAEVMLDNAASSALLTKLGFREEAVLKNRGFWKGQHHDLNLWVKRER